MVIKNQPQIPRLTVAITPQSAYFWTFGGHTGETLSVATQRAWGFDEIHVFEPASSCWPRLKQLANSRTTIHPFGLWECETQLALHNPGSIGASVCSDKDPVSTSELCQFKDVADWFEGNLSELDHVIAKINAEGAEVEIISRLAERRQIYKIKSLLIHFDARKSPSRSHRVREIAKLLVDHRIPFLDAAEIVWGNVGRGTSTWLQWCFSTSATRNLHLHIRTLESRARYYLYPVKVSLFGR